MRRTRPVWWWPNNQAVTWLSLLVDYRLWMINIQVNIMFDDSTSKQTNKLSFEPLADALSHKLCIGLPWTIDKRTTLDFL